MSKRSKATTRSKSGVVITSEASGENVTLLRNDSLHKDERVDFPLKTAANILRMQERKKWNHYTLPEDSKYIFQNGDISTRSSASTDSDAS